MPVDVDRMEVCQGADQRHAGPSAQVRTIRQHRRLLGADDDAASPLHHVEDGPDHGEVVAEQIRPRRQREDTMKRREPAMLARHVVRGWRKGPEGRPAQHELGLTEADKIGQVRVATGELLDLHVTRHVEIGNAGKLTIIAGPCQLESRNHAFDMAGALKEACGKLGVGLIYKTSFDKANRTSAATARGVGLEVALPIFADLRKQLGVPVLTDVHERDQCAAVAQAVDVLRKYLVQRSGSKPSWIPSGDP